MTQHTVEQLQKHLSAEPREIIPGYLYKDVAPCIFCADGVSLSVQASESHYSTPRENFGPYHNVEVWCIRGITGEVSEFEYDESEPSAQVPIHKVAAFIDSHGGMVESVIAAATGEQA